MVIGIVGDGQHMEQTTISSRFATVRSLLRLCDVHNVPVATNIATAEALIHALDRGDLDWRMYAHDPNAMIF